MTHFEADDDERAGPTDSGLVRPAGAYEHARERYDRASARLAEVSRAEARCQGDADRIEARLAELTIDSPPELFAALAGERERLALLRRELKRLFVERQQAEAAYEEAENRYSALESDLMVSRSIIADLREHGLKHRPLQSLEVGHLLGKVELARARLAQVGERIPPIAIEI